MRRGQAQRGVVLLQFQAEGFYDEVVVFALGEAGDGYGSDDSGSGDDDREAAAVGGVVGFGEVVAVAEGHVVLLEVEADRVGAAVEAGDDVRFCARTQRGCRGRAGEGGVEERLVGLAEAADVGDDALIAGESKLAEGEADAPGGVVVEGGEDEFFFLAVNGG